MKNNIIDLTHENDYFSTQMKDNVLVFTYKGNTLLTSTMIKVKEMIFDIFKRAEAHPNVRIVILTQTARKPRREEYLAFYDMLASSRLSETSVMRLHRTIDQIILFVLSSDLFFITANCGQILSMVTGLGMACDYRILGDNAVIQNPSLEVGLAPKGGAPFFLSHSVGKGKIYDLLLANQDITAQEALEIGLADRLVPIATFEEDVMAIAAQFAALPPSSLCLAKRLINFSILKNNIESYLEYENSQMLKVMNQTRMMGKKERY